MCECGEFLAWAEVGSGGADYSSGDGGSDIPGIVPLSAVVIIVVIVVEICWLQ